MKILLIFLTVCSISWCDKSPVNKKQLNKIGQYEFQNENGYSVVKSYYVSRDLLVTWLDAFVMCKAFGMDLAELPTAAEADYFFNLCDQLQNVPNNQYFHIGATYVGAGNNEFYWMTTEKRVDYAMKWGPNQPDHPGREKGLSVYKPAGTFKFNDIGYYANRCYFICQHITYSNQY